MFNCFIHKLFHSSTACSSWGVEFILTVCKGSSLNPGRNQLQGVRSFYRQLTCHLPGHGGDEEEQNVIVWFIWCCQPNFARQSTWVLYLNTCHEGDAKCFVKIRLNFGTKIRYLPQGTVVPAVSPPYTKYQNQSHKPGHFHRAGVFERRCKLVVVLKRSCETPAPLSPFSSPCPNSQLQECHLETCLKIKGHMLSVEKLNRSFILTEMDVPIAANVLGTTGAVSNGHIESCRDFTNWQPWSSTGMLVNSGIKLMDCYLFDRFLIALSSYHKLLSTTADTMPLDCSHPWWCYGHGQACRWAYTTLLKNSTSPFVSNRRSWRF